MLWWARFLRKTYDSAKQALQQYSFPQHVVCKKLINLSDIMKKYFENALNFDKYIHFQMDVFLNC